MSIKDRKSWAEEHGQVQIIDDYCSGLRGLEAFERYVQDHKASLAGPVAAQAVGVVRSRIKHLGVEGGGSSGGGGGVRAFEPEVVKQLSQVCGQVRNSPKKSLPSLCIVAVKCLSRSLGQHVTRSSGAT